MASLNRVILVGNVTRDPEVKYTQNGMAVAELDLAVNDKRKNAQGEWVDETTFVDITLWGRTAEVATEYLAKGAPVLIEGRLKLDSWQTNDGQKRSKLKVVGERMQMLGTKGQQQAPCNEYEQPSPPNEGVDEPRSRKPAQSDIPFSLLLPFCVSLGTLLLLA